MSSRRSLAATSSLLAALLAGIVGWSWSHLLASPAVGHASLSHRLTAATFAAAIFAFVGWALAPTAPTDDGRPPRPSPLLLVVLVLTGGALTGALTASIHQDDILSSMFLGILGAGLLLLPVAGLVVTLRRAIQVRRGSVVARAEGRAALALLAAVLGCSTTLLAPDWPAILAGLAVSTPPVFALMVVSAALVVGVLLADLCALARVQHLASAGDVPEGSPGAPLARIRGDIDLGVGDAIAAHHGPGTAYRGGGRLLVRVAGDPDQAALALGRCIRRGAFLVALLEAVAFLHGAVRSLDLAADLGAERCEHGDVHACREAALLAERAGRPLPLAAGLHERACNHGEEQSCLAVSLIQRRASAP
ncbi:hypothetical protein [Chondromyces apiculatus]|nr:hypothetical protein [Chondromyces apiculatus]